MKRAWLFLAAAALWNATNLFAATITLTNADPRNSNSNLVDRDWSVRLRNFGVIGDGSEVYIGSGDLNFSGNRKVADLVWSNTPTGVNTFTLTYSPSPARVSITASGSTSASQFYDFQTPVANPNQLFNGLLIHLRSVRQDAEIRITNLVLTITGGATTNLGTIQVAQGENIFGLIGDIPNAYTSGFSLSGNVVYVEGFQSGFEERPRIEFFALFDRGQPVPADLTLSKSHTGNFTQGQIGATYTLTARNIGAGATTGTVTVVDNFPPSLSATSASGSGWTCTISTNTATCTRSDPLAAGASYPPITLTVNVASTTPAEVVNAAVITGGGDGNSANNTVLDPTTIIRATDLTIAKTANGSFTQGQSGAGFSLTVTNTGGIASSGTVSVIDNLPTGLSPATISGTGWSCGISGNTATCTRSDSLAAGANHPPITVTVNVASNAPPSVTNVATVGGGGDLNAANNTASAVTPIARAPDLTISKSHTGNFTQGQTATYTVTITNTGAAPTAATVVVADPIFLPLTPRTASGSGWTCDVLTELIRCQRSDALAPGASYPTITMTASIAPNAPPTILNMATVSGGGDGNASNNSASDTATVVPASDLAITKSHTGNFTQGQPGTYTVTVSNVGGSPTSGSVTVIDELPAGLVPTTASGTGWTCPIAGQGVSCTRSDPLAPTLSYPAITITVSVQPNAPASVTNTAVVFGGGEVNPANNTAPDPTTITAGPNLTITKSHTGNFTQGQAGAYTLTVSNTGAAPTSGTISVTDSLPSGLASTAATGAGWSCTAGGQSVTCTRSDPLAPGASSPITLTVQVAANAPASVTNTANVAGGGDVDSSNNTASDPTTIIAVPDLTLTKMHTGSFLQGQVGATYTLTAMNIGGGPTSSPVTVSDTLPAGLTPTAAAGAGWVCNIAGQAVSCTRGDAINIGASYPAITLTVNVAPAAPPSLTNTATVSGGGEINAANNTASDITTIGPGPDLTLNKTHSGNFLQGQTGAIYTITVSNPGSPPTTGIVTVTDNVPAGLIPTSAAGSGWICSISGQDVTCTRSDPLATGQNYPPITLSVNVQPGAPGSVTNAVTVSGGGDVNPANNSGTDVTAIIPGADLTITKNHTGSFTQGQTGATYTVTVTNSGVGPTTAPVTVTDTFPLGLTPTAAVGGGWSCSVGALAVGCSRSDPLAAGASYPPLTITLNVASDAPATVTNVVSVSGGGDSNAANNTASDATTIMAGADLTVTKTHTGTFTQGQKGAAYTITVGNSGGVPTSGAVTAIDLVPTGLVPFAATGTGWVCDIIGQAITCVRSDPMSPGGLYPPIVVTVDVAANAPVSVTNTARVTGGGDTNPANNTIDDVTTINPGPDLTLTKTHAGTFVQGQTGATYTLTVSNQAGAPTTGTVLVNDTLPTELLPTAATGTGWTCALVSASVQCRRSDALAVGASYPPITITLNVAPNAPASVTNTADVSGGGDVNAANNTASDLTAIVSGPDLTVTKTHTATFTQGERGAVDALFYTLTVGNSGGAPTTGTVTLIDNVPTGLIPVSASGTGWTCSISAQSVSCIRADALAIGASYPAVTLGVDVESDAPASVVNTATIAGGGDVNASNNTANDPTQINSGQNLTISKSHTGSFTQGQTGVTYTISVANDGGVPTLGTVTLIDTIPTGLFPTAGSGTGWTCTVSGQTVNCTRADPLAGGASYPPVTITVDVAADAPASITNTAIVAGGGDVLSLDNIADDDTTVATGPDLTIEKTHPDGFAPGQAGGNFILTVTNPGGSPTEGLVNVVDDMPVGLTAKAASGDGWTCEVSDQTVACSRTDALAPGASYPSITVTADVDPDLAVSSILINIASVSRGGDVNPGNNTAEDVVVLSLYTQYFAEGATGFFQADVGILNASATNPANVTLRVFPDFGPPLEMPFMLAPLTRRTVDLNAALAPIGQAASVMIESDQPIAATRQLTWGDPVYGSTLESGIARTSRTWYFAEGATTMFTVYYLVENAGDTPATVTLTHLLAGGAAPIAHATVVPPFARGTILVNDVPGLTAAEFATIVTSDVPIVAERAMYLNSTNRMWEGGAAGRGATVLSTSWSFAEGATGFFNDFVLIGNPAASEATVTVNYHLSSGTTLTRSYAVAPQSRQTVYVNLEDPQLESTAMAMSITSTLPIVAERAMWWGPFPWTEGSAGIGTMATGTMWAIGESAEGGSSQASTYVLVASASPTVSSVRVTLVYDDGTTEQKDYTMPGNTRLTIPIASDFLQASGQRFSAVVESLTPGAPITVEYARYQSPTSFGDGGGAALATRIR